MRKLKKPLSLVLALMLALSMFGICATASAAEVGAPLGTTGHSGTITVTSNISDPVNVNYDYYNDTVTITYSLLSPYSIVNTQAYVQYDSSVLELGDVDLDENFPQLNKGSVVFNSDIEDYLYINASKINFYNFKTQKVYYTQTFNIIGTGDTTVNLTMEILTGSDKTDYAQATNENDISLVEFDTIASTGFTFTAAAQLSGEEPATEPPTEEPTQAPTEEPTEEPTQAPTEEPTEAPTDTPEQEAVSFKLVAPTSTYAKNYNWNDAVFFYGATNSMDSAQKVTMTDTGDKFYVTETFNSTIITPGAWSVYQVNLTAEQAAAVNEAKFAGFATSNNVNRTLLTSAGNVFKAATGEYGAYSTTAAAVNNFDGKTFVFAEASYGATSPISYKGYWIDSYVTVKAAAPLANTAYSAWDSMQLYYGDTAALASMSAIDMFNTKQTTKVSTANNMTIKNGRWYIYAITLTDDQAEAVNDAAYVGLKKANAENRTAILMNVLKAKTDSFDGTYGTARTLEDVEGQVFVICGQTKTGSSVATYVGQWETEEVYTAGDDDEITIYFAVPAGSKAANDWGTAIDFYYGGTTYKDATKMQMTYEPNLVYNSDYSGSTLVSGNCKVFSLTIAASQIKAIDESKVTGFVKRGSYNRTYYSQGKSVVRASADVDNQTYGLPQSIEVFDGKAFVVTGHAANDEQVSYTGYWN